VIHPNQRKHGEQQPGTCRSQVWTDGKSEHEQTTIGRQSLRGGSQEPIRHGNGDVEGLVASFLAVTASSSARSLPLLCRPWVFWCPLTLLSLAFAVVKSHLQNQAFTSESIRACSPSFAWAGVLPAQIDRNTHLPHSKKVNTFGRLMIEPLKASATI
jgi:hypothetical protein